MNVERRPRRRAPAAALLALLAALLLVGSVAVPAPSAVQAPAAELQSIRAYIDGAWGRLTRSVANIPEAAEDPKVAHVPGEPRPVYVAATDDVERVRRQLRIELRERFPSIDVRALPADPLSIRQHGLLYLPHPYVVPGGRFNEMYGWDSYFIQVGLLADDEVGRAGDLVENFLYEVRHFGKVLNANRTYYLTRSQPPLLARMVLALFERTKDRAWLRKARPIVEAYHQFWVTGPHLLDNGLSRYWDIGEGPAPEVVHGERDEAGLNHYERVRTFYRTHSVDDYDVARYYDRRRDRLTSLFYKGDRSMRESGFDPSNRFGLFGVDVINYAPVCLNTLLYSMEDDLATIARILEDERGESAWRRRAQSRREKIDRYLWDEDAGLYFDYHVERRQRRSYPFATTFYPLWAGAASRAQAERVRRNLAQFEAPGGLLTSTRTTGSQWDAPFGWAPLQMMAVDGLRRYGFTADADRIARKFVSLVVEEFRRTGTIVEKYDVQRRRSEVAGRLQFGYATNEIGFGWTNAAWLHLSADLRR